MNAKVLFKAVFLMIVLLLLVMMGMYNAQPVTFRLPPLIAEIKQKSGIMYFAFFAIGFLSGTIVMAGGGKKGAAAGKPSKSDK